MSSPNSPATNAVTAGMRKMMPTNRPSAATMARIQNRMASGMWAEGPIVPSSQASPPPASQAIRRCSAMPTTISSTAASPMDFNSTVRNGGDAIWDKALAAASSIVYGSLDPRSLMLSSRPSEARAGSMNTGAAMAGAGVVVNRSEGGGYGSRPALAWRAGAPLAWPG